MSVKVVRHVEFEAAHMLSGYDGGCGSLHGHSYKLEVTLTCPESERLKHDFGFVTDFKNLNRILKDNVPDHMFMYDVTKGLDTPEGQIVKILQDNGLRTWAFPGSSSAENMSGALAETIQRAIDKEFPNMGMLVTELKLWETTNSHAIWTLDK